MTTAYRIYWKGGLPSLQTFPSHDAAQDYLDTILARESQGDVTIKEIGQ